MKRGVYPAARRLNAGLLNSAATQSQPCGRGRRDCVCVRARAHLPRQAAAAAGRAAAGCSGPES